VTLWIAIGNPLRCDDGVAHELFSEARHVMQLTPEMAADIASCETVVFADADVLATEVCIEPVVALPYEPSITHQLSPARLVGLSQAFFGFTGKAYVCRIPARDFSASFSASKEAMMSSNSPVMDSWRRRRDSAVSACK
jgi:Ni,Fe-hydrogenase maturation factor